MKRSSDKVLIEWLVIGTQQGDVTACNRLIELMYPKLLRYATRLVNDPELAKDMVQNAFEVLSRDLVKIKDPAAFSAWIYRITHNKCVDQIRQQRNTLEGTDQYQQEVSSQLPLSDEPNALWLEEVFKRLNAEQYQLTHLYYLEGFSVKEVAQTLGLREGTVKSRLFQLRKQLKPLLFGETDD